MLLGLKKKNLFCLQELTSILFSILKKVQYTKICELFQL